MTKLVGNCLGSAPVSGTGYYRYDALYRLTYAEGREHPGQQPTDTEVQPSGVPHPNDLQALTRYNQSFAYDAVGNIDSVMHQGGAGWTRLYEYAADSNRLLKTYGPSDIPGTVQPMPYDAHGSITQMPHLSTMAWDFADRLQHTERSGGGGQHTYFTYDASGERVRKVYEHDNLVEERIYLGGFEIYRKRATSITNPVDLERETLHVMDDVKRVAMVETKTVDTSPGATGIGASLWRFQLSNHLDSASMELDEAAGVLSYEEYHPYGSTAFHSAKAGAEVSAKRYRYTGKERDEETGLYYHGARYYAPWLGRWTAADPAGLVDGLNLYRYSRDNPVTFNDPGGTESAAGFNEDQTVYTDEQGVQFFYEENKGNPFDPDPHIVFPDDPLVVEGPDGQKTSKPKPKPEPEADPQPKEEAPEPQENSLFDDALDFVRESSTAQFGIGIGLGIGLGFAPGGFLVSGGGSLSGLDENLPPAVRAGIGIGETLAGLSEIASGIGGEVGSLGLSATGIGAVAGVPGAIASAALIAEGIADVGTGMAVFAKALDDGAANSTPSSTGGPQPGQVPSKPSSTTLGKNLEDAGSTRPPGTAAHHIVAGDAKGAEQARQVLKKYGIDINDASNGAFLPRFKSSPNPNGAAVHSTLHTRKYYDIVNDALSQARSKAEVLEVLESLRLDLLGGGL